MLDEQQKRKLETAVVELTLTLRSAYLREMNGRPPLGYWTQIQNRMRSAARQTTSASEWASTMQRRLQVGSLNSSDSRVLIELVRFCDEHDCHEDMLDMVTRDHALLVAQAQVIVEERKESAAKSARLDADAAAWGVTPEQVTAEDEEENAK